MGKPLGTIVEVEPFKKKMETKGYVTSTENEQMPEKGKVLSVGSGVDKVKSGDSLIRIANNHNPIVFTGVIIMNTDSFRHVCLILKWY